MIFYGLQKAGRHVMTFGPAVAFDDNISWSELDRVDHEVFVKLGEFFDQPDFTAVRDRWRKVQLIQGEQIKDLDVLKIKEWVPELLNRHRARWKNFMQSQGW